MPKPNPTPTHLIIICCHSIYIGGPSHGLTDSEWLLAPFQSGEPPTFISHIKAGLSLLSTSPSSLLIFSGSKTRQEVELSEARSYLNLCEDNQFWGILDARGKGFRLDERVLLEEQALDSLGNVLFSLVAFWRCVGGWPGGVTVVGFEFKRARVLRLHFRALRGGLLGVRYLGIDPAYMVQGGEAFDQERAGVVRKGEEERGYKVWESDLRGEGEVLRGKRRGRNFWGVEQGLFLSEGERTRSGLMSRLVEWQWEGQRVVEEVLLDKLQPWEKGMATGVEGGDGSSGSSAGIHA